MLLPALAKKMTKLHVVAVAGLCLMVALTGCATPKMGINPGVMYLYSWQTDNSDYAFALVRKIDNENFLSTFDRHTPHIRGIVRLDVEFAKLPRGSGVAWRDHRS